MAFFTELWESVFTPGTTPALIKATHVSFVLLILSLLSLIYLSRSIHFINLLVIALLLYGSVIWFINELNEMKLKNNTELEKEEQEKEKEKDQQEKDGGKKDTDKSESTATAKPISPKKRKV